VHQDLLFLPLSSFTLIPSCAFLNASAIRSEKATVMRRWWDHKAWLCHGSCLEENKSLYFGRFYDHLQTSVHKFPPPPTGHSADLTKLWRLPPTLDGRVLAGDGTSVSTWRPMQRLKAYMDMHYHVCIAWIHNKRLILVIHS